jgi:O-antigen/teichoic acid export membrane protein
VNEVKMENCEEIIDTQVAPDTGETPCDLSGKDQLVRNVLFSWAGHMVFVISGFILPRMINDYVGQGELGIWDFGWSLTGYFGFVIAGISSAVNRYIAKYRAVNDYDSLRSTFSSMICFQGITAIMIGIFSLIGMRYVPLFLGSQMTTYIGEAKIVVLLLGSSVAIQVAFGPCSGVLTGCHRWDLYNGLNAGFHLAIVACWVCALIFGGGLICLAWINLVGILMTEIVRAYLAYRTCPQCRFEFKHIHLKMMIIMLTFGVKTLLTTVSKLLLYQTTNLLVVGFMGPSALAVFSRPSGLIRNAMIFVNKFAYVLTPTASCLHAQGQKEELGKLLITTTRYAVGIVLPLVIFMAIMGKILLYVWMGPQYSHDLLLTILAIGHMTAMVQQPVWNILAGMNRHGRMGLANMCAAVAACILCMISLTTMNWGLNGVAISVAIPLTIANGIYVPLYACRHLEITIRKYLIEAIFQPVMCAIPFTLWLIISYEFIPGYPITALFIGALGGGVILGVLYWRYILSFPMRNQIISYGGRLYKRLMPANPF